MRSSSMAPPNEEPQRVPASSEQYLLSDLSPAASSGSSQLPGNTTQPEKQLFSSGTAHTQSLYAVGYISSVSYFIGIRNTGDANNRPRSSDEPTKNSTSVYEIQSDASKNERRDDIKVEENWRVRGLASKKDLTLWFPQIGVDEYGSWRIWMSKRSQALLLHTITVAAILIANFALTLFALSRYTHPNGLHYPYLLEVSDMQH